MSLLHQLEQALSNDPALANLSLSDFLSKIRSENDMGDDRIPSVGKSSHLLNEITPKAKVGAKKAFTQEDLSLLKIGHVINVEFDVNDNGVPKVNVLTKNGSSNKNSNNYNENQIDDVSRSQNGGSTMKNIDFFNTLLIGCRWLLNEIKIVPDKDKDKDEKEQGTDETENKAREREGEREGR